ncbi:MAG TPA: hypothetical protein DEB40_05650 [Elusimicrobia bacterium]|nr:hypothetical protein [Elusimicrobiota bacterium]HBT61209.1 hypothetical protein [Elusimicrobiota bacterium]
MEAKFFSRGRKILSAFLAAALIALTPGLGCYEAVAAVILRRGGFAAHVVVPGPIRVAVLGDVSGQLGLAKPGLLALPVHRVARVSQAGSASVVRLEDSPAVSAVKAAVDHQALAQVLPVGPAQDDVLAFVHALAAPGNERQELLSRAFENGAAGFPGMDLSLQEKGTSHPYDEATLRWKISLGKPGNRAWKDRIRISLHGIQSCAVGGARSAPAGLKAMLALVTLHEAADPPILSVLAATAVLLPFPLIGSFAFHELGHFLAYRLLGARANVRFYESSDDSFGGYVQAATSARQASALTQVFVSLSGPAFGWIYRAGLLAAGLAAGSSGLIPLTAYLSILGMFELHKAFMSTYSDYAKAAEYFRMMRDSGTWNILLNPAPREELERVARSYNATPQGTMSRALQLLDFASENSDKGRLIVSNPGQDDLRIKLPESKPGRKAGRTHGAGRLVLRFGRIDDDIGMVVDGSLLGCLKAARARLGISTGAAIRLALGLLDGVRPRLRDDGTILIRGRKATPVSIKLWSGPRRPPTTR